MGSTFNERENLDPVTLVLGAQLLVASKLIGNQRLQCIDVIGQLMQGNRHEATL